MDEPSGKLKSLGKAIDILDILASDTRGFTLASISARSGYPKSTVHAILSTMRDRRLVKQLDDGAYTLGIKMFEYGAAVSRGFDIASIAHPYLERLANATASSAVLSMLDADGVVSFDYAMSPAGVRIVPEIGERLPLHATSQGKLMLSSLSRTGAERLLRSRGMKSYTPHTLTDTDLLLKELYTIRESGYSIEDGEYKVGMRSVSAPVYDGTGALRYALTTLGFFRRAGSEEFRAVVDATTREAKLLSSALQ